MRFHVKLKIRFVLPIMALLFLMTSCCQSGPRDLKNAGNEATYAFEDYLIEDDIDIKYFRGPTLKEENDSLFIFTWVCTVPGTENSWIEEYVPKNPKAFEGGIGFRWKGRFPPLGGTRLYSLNETALQNLFDLPLNNDAGTLRLRKVPLTQGQYWDVASFCAIARQIREYAYCFNCAYPDSLSWLKSIREGKYGNNCNVKELDSLLTHDRFGHEYIYENLINFVVIGTPGANGKWDFAPAIMDSIYNDSLEHIYVNDDDIIVKLRPKSLGCD